MCQVNQSNKLSDIYTEKWYFSSKRKILYLQEEVEERA